MRTRHYSIILLVFGAIWIVSCGADAKVGELQTDSQSIELGDAESVSATVNLGAGDLKVNGGADKLLEADFAYNVEELKPEVTYANGTLVVQHPEVNGLPALQGITDFRNEWDLRLSNEAPMDLSVDMGAGTSNLQLAGLSLTGLDVTLGAGEAIIDLSGDWARDFDVTVDTGAADVTVRLPSSAGARVEVDAGLTSINASGLTKDGNVYTNAVYGSSGATLHIKINAGIGQMNLEVVEQT